MKVYDGFLFNDELDLLELRLETLNDVVDCFILVEQAHNFRMQPKPLHFKENKARFDKWKHKIRHIVLENYPIEPHPVMEHFQRRSISMGCEDADTGDILMLGDVDEIPRASLVGALRNIGVDRPLTCLMRLYYYKVNFLQPTIWAGTVFLPIGAHGKSVAGRLGSYSILDLELERQQRFYNEKMADAGWHFSFLGTAKQIQNKLRSIDVERDSALYHTEDSIKAPDSDDLNFLELCSETGRDLYGRSGMDKKLVPIEPGVGQPVNIEAWLAKYPHYAASKEERPDHGDRGVEATA